MMTVRVGNAYLWYRRQRYVFFIHELLNDNEMTMIEEIFKIKTDHDFNRSALKIFRYQLENNGMYRKFVDALGIDPSKVDQYTKIPFLPISFFKTDHVIGFNTPSQAIFMSSGTTGMVRSLHHVKDISIYQEASQKGFELFYGPLQSYRILALAPSPSENPNSSLGFMLNHFMNRSQQQTHHFFLQNFKELDRLLHEADFQKEKVILFGLTSALLDFGEMYECNYPDLIVVETGGMKGKRKEMVREELHDALRALYKVERVHSEYGMTELLSQSYSKGDGIFETPPWMKILIRETDDPFSFVLMGKTGGINIIDLANAYSCSFIATQDLGQLTTESSFKVMGRFDHSDLRGCNLMVD